MHKRIEATIIYRSRYFVRFIHLMWKSKR